MDRIDKINKVNAVLADYFANRANSEIVAAKDLMPLFIKNGIFEKDYKNGLPIRKLFRDLDGCGKLGLIPFVYAERKVANTNWFFVRHNSPKCDVPTKRVCTEVQHGVSSRSRENSDEYYVIGLCNEVLGQKALQQYKFDFLKGDTGRPLPVDAYYKELGLVIEYCEAQHTVLTPFFDSKITATGITRGEQRKKYDELRQKTLPLYNISLVVFNYFDFGTTKRLKRNREKDLEIVRKRLHGFI